MLDVSLGNPKFLEPYWDNINLKLPKKVPTSYIYHSLEELRQTIKKLHQQEKNAIVKNKYIVIGNGATQILNGLFSILKGSFIAPIPHYSKFPKIVQQTGQKWELHPQGHQIITSPNNPCGKLDFYEFHSLKKIYDLSYNWRTYTDTVKNYNEDIMIFSMSKATGHASTRIGWVILSNKELADKLTQFIELNTGGVSLESQYKAIKIIESQLNRKNTCFKYGEQLLKKRWKIVTELNNKKPKKVMLDDSFKILNKNGMFLWLYKDKNVWNYSLEEIMNKKKIVYCNGKDFGSSENHGRINLGCSEKEFKDLVKRLYD